MKDKIRYWLMRGIAALTAAALTVSAGPAALSLGADYNLGYFSISFE